MRTSLPQSEHLTVGKICDILSDAMIIKVSIKSKKREENERMKKKGNIYIYNIYSTAAFGLCMYVIMWDYCCTLIPCVSLP